MADAQFRSYGTIGFIACNLSPPRIALAAASLWRWKAGSANEKAARRRLRLAVPIYLAMPALAAMLRCVAQPFMSPLLIAGSPPRSPKILDLIRSRGARQKRNRLPGDGQRFGTSTAIAVLTTTQHSTMQLWGRFV
jgi:hypothetical protein